MTLLIPIEKDPEYEDPNSRIDSHFSFQKFNKFYIELKKAEEEEVPNIYTYSPEDSEKAFYSQHYLAEKLDITEESASRILTALRQSGEFLDTDIVEKKQQHRTYYRISEQKVKESLIQAVEKLIPFDSYSDDKEVIEIFSERISPVIFTETEDEDCLCYNLVRELYKELEKDIQNLDRPEPGAVELHEALSQEVPSQL